MKNNLKIKCIIILFVPLIIIINSLLKRYPQLIETYYSNIVDKFIREALSLVTGIVPFSVAELLIAILLVILIYLLTSLIIFILRARKKKALMCFINIAVYLSALYLIFMILWGFNYNRLSFDKIAGLNMEKSSKQQLYELCDNLIERANALRNNVKENSKGVMYIEGGYKNVFERSSKGYEKASVIYSELGGNYGPPKPVLLSEGMCYTGITGIYMPYTGEANVNVNITDLMLPCTASHEMAHQRGFSREDEANYIAYVTCSMHPDADFQYSGVMLALIYSMNALADNDINLYKELKVKYSTGVKSDLQYENEFWKKYSGKAEKISNKVNNTYLKSNGQQDGVESYGRMVDLLLAEYKKVYKNN